MLEVRAPFDRYVDLRVIRRNVWSRVVSAQRRDDERRLVLVTSERAEPAADAALERLAKAHARIDHPGIPRCVEQHRFDGRRVVVLDCPAIADAHTLEERLSATRTLVPYACGDGFVRGIRLAMQGAHATPDDEGAPHCLGRLSPANVLLDAEGRSHLVGFGHNVVVDGPDGRPMTSLPYTEAPERSIDAPPSPNADYVAVLLLSRMLSRHTDKRGALGVILRAVTSRPNDTLVEVLRFIETKFIGAPPGVRGSIEEGIAAADRIRDLLGVEPDPDGFARLAARLLADRPVQITSAVEDIFYVGPESAFVRFRGDDPIELRGPMRRLVLALADQHSLGGGTLLRSVELAEIGWPNESASYEAMMNRVYVTLTRLRKRLPDGVLQRFDDGYRLSPEIVVHRA
ncbi:MAG: hypothetical protein KF901_21850 [Myxococcales bacterium]|nr:hypothetical protein [Myxococcales bacterium]